MRKFWITLYVLIGIGTGIGWANSMMALRVPTEKAVLVGVIAGAFWPASVTLSIIEALHRDDPALRLR